MSAETVRAIGDVIAGIWVAVGPLVGGLLGARFTARHQRNMEDQRRAAEDKTRREQWQHATKSQAYFRAIETGEKLCSTATQVVWFLRPSDDVDNAFIVNRERGNEYIDRWGTASHEMHQAMAMIRAVGQPRIADAGEALIDAADAHMQTGLARIAEARKTAEGRKAYDPESSVDLEREAKRALKHLIDLIRQDLGVDPTEESQATREQPR